MMCFVINCEEGDTCFIVDGIRQCRGMECVGGWELKKEKHLDYNIAVGAGPGIFSGLCFKFQFFFLGPLTDELR